MLLLGSEVSGRTLGIVGAGRIGTAVGLRSLGFGMRVLYTDGRTNAILEEQVRAERVPLFALLKRADYVTLHVPLLLKTTHLIGEKELRRMKASAVLINTSRGPVVDEKALVVALQSGWIAGAGLDVLTSEPPEQDNPLLLAKNCFITPHISWATRAARQRLLKVAVENVVAFLAGKPQNIVNNA